MTATPAQGHAWAVAPAQVNGPEAAALLRDFYVDVADRYSLLRFGRRSTSTEIKEGLAGTPSDDLTPPGGLFLLGTHSGRPAACAGLRVLDPDTVELTKVFVRPRWRGTGGGACLLSAVEETAIGMGAKRTVLDTRLDLVEARALHQARLHRDTGLQQPERIRGDLVRQGDRPGAAVILAVTRCRPSQHPLK